MLSKLLKYEFKSTGRIFGLCYIGVLAAAVLLRLLGALAWDSTWNGSDQVVTLLPAADIAAALSTTLYVVMVVAVIVVTFILILQRFYKNLLGGEGYLMHTLPVPAWQHIASKLIAAVVWTVLSTVVVALSILILAMTGDLFQAFCQEFGPFLTWFRANMGMSFFLLALEFCAVMLVGVVASVLQIYAAIMIGHQAAKHKIALAVGAYFGISMVLDIILSVLMNLAYFAVPDAVWNWFSGLLETGSMTMAFHVMMLFALVYSLVLCVVFFAVTEHMMRRNLNLE